MKKLTAIIALSLAFSTGNALAKNDHKNNDKKLPPGLQKKVEKTGELPPGWQKKLSKGDILDLDIYRHGRIIKQRDRDGLITIEVDNTLIRMVEDSREILSILSR